MSDGDKIEALVTRPHEEPRPRLLRFAAATVGAAAITVGLMLFMYDLVSRFIERDPIRYFSITSFIPAPDRGRQLPDVPIAPAQAPDAPELTFEEEDGVILEVPEVIVEPEAPPAGQPLNLD